MKYFFANPSSDAFQKIYKRVYQDDDPKLKKPGSTAWAMLLDSYEDGDWFWCPCLDPRIYSIRHHDSAQYATLEDLLSDPRLSDIVRHHLMQLEI